MGCWSHQIFCDDTSWDALDELNDSQEPVEALERFLDEAIECDDYLDYDVCEYALAAAAIVDAALNGVDWSLLTDASDDEGVEKLLDKLSADDVSYLREKALQAVELVQGENSEVRELAEENEEHFVGWNRVLDSIRQRLGA